MSEFIEGNVTKRRTLDEALADLRTDFERNPRPELAVMIRRCEAEIAARSQGRRPEIPM